MENWVVIISPLIQVVLAVVAGFWAVFTKSLSISIDHLTQAINEIKEAQKQQAMDLILSKEKIALEVANVKERLHVIESKCSYYHERNGND